MKQTMPLLALSIFMMNVSFTYGQWNTRGYFECETDVSNTPGDHYFGYTKIRLDLGKRINIQIETNCSLLAKQYWGRQTYVLSDFLPVSSNENIPAITFNDTLYFDNLYAVWRTPEWGEFVIGRQPVSLGAGYVWNPTDIFTSKDNIDPTYEIQGITAVRWLISAGRFEIDSIIQPIDNGKMINSYFGVTGHIHHFDITPSIHQRHYKGDMTTDQLYNGDVGYGLSVVGEVFTAGVWMETNLVFQGEQYPNTREWTLGMEYTTHQSVYFLAEAYHNDSGADATTGQYYAFSRVFDYLDGNIRALAKNYIMILVQYPLNQWWSIGCWTIGNLDDKSEIVSLQLAGCPLKDTTIDLSAFTFTGNKLTEFGVQDAWVRVRLNLYF